MERLFIVGCFFSSVTTIPIAALREGCWSLSQLHTGEVREHTWQRVRRLAHECLSSCSGTSPAISTPSKCPKPGIEPVAFTSQHHFPIYCVVRFFVFFLRQQLYSILKVRVLSAQLLTHRKQGLFYFENSLDDLFSFPYPTSCPARSAT